MAEHPLAAIQKIDPKMMDHRLRQSGAEICQEIGLTERGCVPISIASPQDMTRPVTERSGLGVAGPGMGGWA